MKDSDTKLRHLPFFAELAGLEPDAAAWRSASAGLVTLRLVEAWLEDDADVSPEDWGVKHVLKSIEDIGEGTTVRSLLSRVVEAMRGARPSIHDVVAPLMAYAQALEYDAKWVLASDVYQTLLSRLHPMDDSEPTIAAQLRLGSCYRNLHQLDLALQAYTEAASVGAASGDMVGVLRGRLGEAQVAQLRGNLPRAEALLEETIGRAVGKEMEDLRSRALSDRAAVAALRGQHDLAVRLGYEALSISGTATERDKVLTNIAGAFSNLGVYSAARDAYLILSTTAQDQYVRWVSTLNLLEIAGRTGSETLFEQYRRQLAAEQLPPQLSAGYQLLVGQGYQALGKVDAARGYLERAVAMAGELGLSQFLFEAEHALSTVEQAAQTQIEVEQVPLDLEEVVAAIRGLRVAAGVG